MCVYVCRESADVLVRNEPPTDRSVLPEGLGCTCHPALFVCGMGEGLRWLADKVSFMFVSTFEMHHQPCNSEGERSERGRCRSAIE